MILVSLPSVGPDLRPRFSWLTCLPTLLAAGLLLAAPGLAAAPSLVSTSPASNATGVAVDAPLVFVFDEAMLSLGAVPSVPPFLVGNLEITPAAAADAYGCEWSGDQLTLTCTPSGALPENTRITWTLNPAGTLLPFISEDGSAVPTASGAFTTGAAGGGGGSGGGGGGGGGEGDDTVPVLVSVIPASGAAAVPVTSTVVFNFDQALRPIPTLGGIPPFVAGAIAWTGAGIDTTKFSYSWSADNRSVTCTYSANLPGNTTITWNLNAGDSEIRFQTFEDGVLLAPISGSFTTGAGTGGGGDCDPDGIDDTWGGFTLFKSGRYVQTSAADPVPSTDEPFTFGAVVNSPQDGPAVESASITLPTGTVRNLSALFGGYFFYGQAPATSAALDAAAPSGNYTYKLKQAGQTERTIGMTMPAGNPPTPKVANYAETQAVNAAADFTLRWNVFTGAGVTDNISLLIMDGPDTVFRAPNPCVPLPLPVSATSITIPANTLRAGKAYTCTLSFNASFYANTNSFPQMAGFGGQMRETLFTLLTGGGTPAEPARFMSWELTAAGHPKMTLTGTAGRQYTIQRSPPTFSAPNWTPVGTVIPVAGGVGVFEDAEPAPFPVIYRAVAQ